MSQDWTTRFFENCQDVSEPEMQAVWSRILAGEIAKPRTFHVKTLHTLRDMQKEELTQFSQLARITWFVPGAGFVPVVPEDTNDRIRQMGLNFEGLKHLSYLGLISVQPMGVCIPKQKEIHPLYCGKAFSHYAPNEMDFQIGQVTYTNAGRQLLRFTGATGSDDIGEIALDFWKSQGWSRTKSVDTSTTVQSHGSDHLTTASGTEPAPAGPTQTSSAR